MKDVMLSISNKESLRAIILNSENNLFDVIEGFAHGITNNKWHHVAFVISEDTFYLYFNAKLSRRMIRREDFNFRSKSTELIVSSSGIGNHNLDDILFLERALDANHIQILYENPLHNALQALPVTPTQSITTTWAELKVSE